MSQNNKKKNLNKVSNLSEINDKTESSAEKYSKLIKKSEDILNYKIKIDLGEIVNVVDVTPYNDFYEFYKKQDISKYDTEILIMVYDNGNELLNQYYIQCNGNKFDTEIIVKLQYILGMVNHNINKKLNEELIKNVKIAQSLKNETEKTNQKMENVLSLLQNVTTTIISIILAISIIPTAISGIEKIDGNYILPFVSTIVMFGMIMIIFTYLINHIKIGTGAGITAIIMICIVIILWLLTWKVDINMKPRVNARQVEKIQIIE